MDDVEAVQVFDGAGQVVQHPTGISLSVFVSGGDGIEEVSSLRENSRRKSGLTDGPVGPSLERRPTRYVRGVFGFQEPPLSLPSQRPRNPHHPCLFHPRKGFLQKNNLQFMSEYFR